MLLGIFAVIWKHGLITRRSGKRSGKSEKDHDDDSKRQKVGQDGGEDDSNKRPRDVMDLVLERLSQRQRSRQADPTQAHIEIATALVNGEKYSLDDTFCLAAFFTAMPYIIAA